MLKFIRKQWFLVLLIIVLAVGYHWWKPAYWVKTHVGVTIPVVVQLFLMSFTLPTAHLVKGFTNYRSIAIAFVTGFVFMPVYAFAAAKLGFSPGDPSAIGLAIMVAMPTTLVSNIVWTRNARGDDALALAITVLMTSTCFILSPLIIAATVPSLIGSSGGDVTIRFGELAGAMVAKLSVSLFVKVVLPVALGQLAAKLAKIDTLRYKKPIGLFCQVLVLLIIWQSIGGAGHNVAVMVSPARSNALSVASLVTMLVMVNLVHGMGLLTAAGLSRLARIEPFTRRAVMLSGSQKTLPVAVLVLFTLDKQIDSVNLSMGVITLVAFHACQLVFDTIASGIWNRRKEAPPE